MVLRLCFIAADYASAVKCCIMEAAAAAAAVAAVIARDVCECLKGRVAAQQLVPQCVVGL